MHRMSEGRQTGIEPLFFVSNDRKSYYLIKNPNTYCIDFKTEALIRNAQP